MGHRRTRHFRRAKGRFKRRYSSMYVLESALRMPSRRTQYLPCVADIRGTFPTVRHGSMFESCGFSAHVTLLKSLPTCIAKAYVSTKRDGAYSIWQGYARLSLSALMFNLVMEVLLRGGTVCRIRAILFRLHAMWLQGYADDTVCLRRLASSFNGNSIFAKSLQRGLV